MLLDIERRVIQLIKFIQNKNTSDEKILRFYVAQAKAWLKLDRSLYVTEAKAICEQALELFLQNTELKKNNLIQYYWINYYYADVLYRQSKYLSAQDYCKIATESKENTILRQANLLLQVIQSKLDKKMDPPGPMIEEEIFKKANYQIGEGGKKIILQEKIEHYAQAIDFLKKLKQVFPKSKKMKLYDQRLYYCYCESATDLDSQDNPTPEAINTAYEHYGNAIDLGLQSTVIIDLTKVYIYQSLILEDLKKQQKDTVQADRYFSKAEKNLNLALQQAKHKNTKLMACISKVEFYSRSDNFDECLVALDAAIELLKAPDEAPMDIIGYINDLEITEQVKKFINQLINFLNFLSAHQTLSDDRKFKLIVEFTNRTHQVIMLSKIINKNSQAVRAYANQVKFLLECKTPDLKVSEGCCVAGLALFKKDRRLIKEHSQEYYQLNYAYAKVLLEKCDLINSKIYCERALYHKKIYSYANQQSNINQLNNLLDRINHALFQQKSAELLKLTTLVDHQLAIQEAFELHAKLITEDEKTTELTVKLKQKFIDEALTEANDREKLFRELRQLILDYKNQLQQLKQLPNEVTKKSLKERDIEDRADSLKSKLISILTQINVEFPVLEGQSLTQTSQLAALPIAQSTKLQQQMQNNNAHCMAINAFLVCYSIPKLVAAVALSKKKAKRAKQKQDGQVAAEMAEKKKSLLSLKKVREVVTSAPLMTEEETSKITSPPTIKPPETPLLVDRATLFSAPERESTVDTLVIDDEALKLSSPAATTGPETPSSTPTTFLSQSGTVSPVSPSLDNKTLTADSIGLSRKIVKVIKKINKALHDDPKLTPFKLKLSLYGTKVLNYLLNQYHGITIHSKDTDLFIPKVPASAVYQLAQVLQKEKFNPTNKNIIYFKNYINEDKSIEIAVCSEDYYSYDPFHFTRASITIDENGEITLYCPDELRKELIAKVFELDLPEVNRDKVTNFFTRLIKYYEKIAPLLLSDFKLGANFRIAINEGEGDNAHWQRKYFSELLDLECPHISKSPAHLEMISIIKNGQFVEGSFGERIIGEFCQAVAEKYYEGPLSDEALKTLLTELRLQCDGQTITAETFDAQIHDCISTVIYGQWENHQLTGLPPFIPGPPMPAQHFQVSGTIHHIHHHLYGPTNIQPAFVTPDGQHVVEQVEGHEIVLSKKLFAQPAWDTSQRHGPSLLDQQMNFFQPKERKGHRLESSEDDTVHAGLLPEEDGEEARARKSSQTWGQS